MRMTPLAYRPRASHTVSTAALAALFLAGCGGGTEGAPQASAPTSGTAAAATTTTTEVPAPTAQPQTLDAAKAAAQTFADAYSAGDIAGSWETWTAEAKTVFNRNDYVRFINSCNPITGLTFTIKTARLENPTTAVVSLERGGFAQAYTIRYEDDAWRFQPSEESMATYRLGVDAAIAKRKAELGCN